MSPRNPRRLGGAGLWKAIWGEAPDASAFVTLARNPFYRDEMRRVALAYGHSEPSIDLAFALAKAKDGDADTRAALREMRKDLGAWLGDPANGAHPNHYSLETFASSIDEALEDDNWDWAIGAVLHQDSQAQQLLDPTFSALGGLAAGAAGAALRWRRTILRRDRARANGGDDWTRADYMAAGRLLGGKKYPPRLQKQLKAYMERQGFKVYFDDRLLAEMNVKYGGKKIKRGKKGEKGKKGAAGFLASERKIYFPEAPTYYQIWHELAHYAHYKKMGREAYMDKSLTEVEKEQFVYDMLRGARRWDAKDESGLFYINFKQKRDAIRIIEKLGGRSTPRPSAPIAPPVRP